MLKFLFAALLLVNAILLGAQAGWMDAILSGTHEPQRLKNQINPDKVKVTPPDAAATAAAPSAQSTLSPASSSTAPASSSAPAAPAAPTAPAKAPATAPGPGATVTPAPNRSVAAVTASCTEIGNLSPPEAKRMETALIALKLPQPPVRRETREQSSHMVWIAPLPNGKEGAASKVAELKRMGVSDFHVLPDNSAPAQRHGISLGVFKTEEAAKAQLAALTQKGVKNARIVEYHMPLTRVTFQLRALDAAGKEALSKLRADFPRSEEKNCEGATPT